MKICFWGNIAGALNGSTDGGGELQLAILAKALVKGGHDVVIIDYDTTVDFITVDGIKVFKLKGCKSSIRIIRAFYRISQLYLSLKAQKADAYYCRIRDFRHIFAFWAARKEKAKFILGIAADLDVMDFAMRWKKNNSNPYSSLWSFLNSIIVEIVYPFLLRKADLVLVQHEGQKNILLKKQISSVVFPNIFDHIEPFEVQTNLIKDFIYVGWLDKRKGFVEFFELVKKAPMHTFKVIGPTRDKTASLIYEKLKRFQNVTLLGRLGHSETLNHISNSKALISTSHMEGFPNVFIEAWAYGVPVLSLNVDPGDIIKREELGVVAHGDIDKLLYAMNNNINTDKFAERAKTYVKNCHTLNDNKINEISCLFSEL